MFDSSERLTNRLSTQLAPSCLQNWSQIFFEKILIEQETMMCVQGLAGSTVCMYIHVCTTSSVYMYMYVCHLSISF